MFLIFGGNVFYGNKISSINCLLYTVDESISSHRHISKKFSPRVVPHTP